MACEQVTPFLPISKFITDHTFVVHSNLNDLDIALRLHEERLVQVLTFSGLLRGALGIPAILQPSEILDICNDYSVAWVG